MPKKQGNAVAYDILHAPLVHGFTQSSSGDVKGFWYTLLLWQVVWIC